MNNKYNINIKNTQQADTNYHPVELKSNGKTSRPGEKVDLKPRTRNLHTRENC